MKLHYGDELELRIDNDPYMTYFAYVCPAPDKCAQIEGDMRTKYKKLQRDTLTEPYRVYIPALNEYQQIKETNIVNIKRFSNKKAYIFFKGAVCGKIPRYLPGDEVHFFWGEDESYTGRICNVNIPQKTQEYMWCSYNIYVPSEGLLFKWVDEFNIDRLLERGEEIDCALADTAIMEKYDNGDQHKKNADTVLRRWL